MTSRLDTEAVAAASSDASVVTPEGGDPEGGTTGEEAGLGTRDLGTRDLHTSPADESRGATSSGSGASSLLAEFMWSFKRSLARGNWAAATATAGFVFLALVSVGAVLTLAGKLQYPDLGADSSPASVLSAIVIVSLGVLRIPVHLGGLSLSALPLGALAVVGAVAAWAVRRMLAEREATDLRTAVLEGVRIAAPFALLCWLAALVFRIETVPAAAQAGSALLLGLVWGTVFGALGGVMAHGGIRSNARTLLREIGSRSADVAVGIRAGGVMLLVTLVSGAFAAVLWLIGSLLGGGTSDGFGLGDVGAAIIYLTAFAPNVVAAIIAIGLGAPVEVGAQVNSGGRLIGPLEQLSITGWGGADTPWFVFFLLLIPLSACLLGGFYARTRNEGPGDVVRTIGAAALTYALVLFELAALAEARLGAGLVRERGVGRVAPEALPVALLALLWAIGAGYAGWRIAEAREDEEPEGERPAGGSG